MALVAAAPYTRRGVDRRFAVLVGLLAGVATAFRCIGLAAPWGADNLGTAGYARRPLAIAVMDAATLDDRLRAPRWDVPGGDGRTYVVPSVTPSCFVLPRIPERPKRLIAVAVDVHDVADRPPRRPYFPIGHRAARPRTARRSTEAERPPREERRPERQCDQCSAEGSRATAGLPTDRSSRSSCSPQPAATPPGNAQTGDDDDGDLVEMIRLRTAFMIRIIGAFVLYMRLPRPP